MPDSPVIPDIPTLSEELNRKSFETLEWLTIAVEQGRITAHQFSTGIDVLFMAVSGLVKQEFVELVTEAQALCPEAKPELKRVFWSPAGLLRVTWTVGEERVLVGAPAAAPRYLNFDTAKAAQDKFSGIGVALESKGYTEV